MDNNITRNSKSQDVKTISKTRKKQEFNQTIEISDIVEEIRAFHYLETTSTSNIQKITIDDYTYYVFDALFVKPETERGKTKINQLKRLKQQKNMNVRELEKYAIDNKLFGLLLAIKLLKSNITIEYKVLSEKNSKIYTFRNYYKERKATKYYIKDFSDATHFLTITYKAAEGSFWSKYEYANRTIKNKVRRGFQRMRSYFNKYYNTSPKFIRTLEMTKKGTPHFHVLIKLPEKFREDFKRMIKMLAKWFETEENGIDLKRIKRDEIKAAIKYAGKYINKGDTDHEPGENGKLIKDEEVIVKRLVDKTFAVREDVLLRNTITIRRLTTSRKQKPEVLRYRPSRLVKTEKINIKDYERPQPSKEDIEIFKEFGDEEDIEVKTSLNGLIEYKRYLNLYSTPTRLVNKAVKMLLQFKPLNVILEERKQKTEERKQKIQKIEFKEKLQRIDKERLKRNHKNKLHPSCILLEGPDARSSPT